MAIVVTGCSLGTPKPATDVTTGSATLNGTVYSNQSGEVLYWFEYGTTNQYGTKTPDRALEFPEGHAADDDPVPVSEPISGLAADTTYHYRICTSPGAQAGSRGCVKQDERFTTDRTGLGPGSYIAMGDSLTQIGDSQRYPERFFSFLDGADEAEELHNIGENGQTSGGINGNQLALALDLIDDADTNTRVVTIDIGGNDILTQPLCLPTSSSFNLTSCQPTLNQFSTNFASTLAALNDSLADDPGTEQLIVIAYFNPWSGDGDATVDDNGNLVLRGTDRSLDCDGTGEALGLNDRIACIGAAHGAKLADAYPPFVGHGPIGDYFADDVHPNAAGHQVLADLLQDAYEAP